MSNANGDQILDNKLRRLIYNQIVSYPGISYKKLKNIFELTDNGLRYHLNYFERYQKISSSGVKGANCCYFPHSGSVHIPKSTKNIIGSYKLTPIKERIQDLIMRYLGINHKELVVKFLAREVD